MNSLRFLIFYIGKFCQNHHLSCQICRLSSGICEIGDQFRLFPVFWSEWVVHPTTGLLRKHNLLHQNHMRKAKPASGTAGRFQT